LATEPKLPAEKLGRPRALVDAGSDAGNALESPAGDKPMLREELAGSGGLTRVSQRRTKSTD